MSTKTIAITAPDDVTYDCLIAGDTAPPRPGLLIFSPIFGVDEDMVRLAETWAARGYVVAAPDYYHRVGGGALDRSEAGRKAAIARWKALDANDVLADTAPLVDALKALASCNGRIGALGICAGGELAFLAATRLGIEAVVTYHGTHIDRHVGEAKDLRLPISLHYGDADNLVPIEKVDVVKAALASNTLAEIHVYQGAEHGFSFAGRPTYHARGATLSDQSAQEIFAQLKAAA